MGINTFAQRQKAGYIWETYFAEDAEHLLDFNLFDTIDFFDAANGIDVRELHNKFTEMGEQLWEAMQEFDNKHS